MAVEGEVELYRSGPKFYLTKKFYLTNKKFYLTNKRRTL